MDDYTVKGPYGRSRGRSAEKDPYYEGEFTSSDLADLPEQEWLYNWLQKAGPGGSPISFLKWKDPSFRKEYMKNLNSGKVTFSDHIKNILSSVGL